MGAENGSGASAGAADGVSTAAMPSSYINRDELLSLRVVAGQKRIFLALCQNSRGRYLKMSDRRSKLIVPGSGIPDLRAAISTLHAVVSKRLLESAPSSNGVTTATSISAMVTASASGSGSGSGPGLGPVSLSVPVSASASAPATTLEPLPSAVPSPVAATETGSTTSTTTASTSASTLVSASAPTTTPVHAPASTTTPLPSSAPLSPKSLARTPHSVPQEPLASERFISEGRKFYLDLLENDRGTYVKMSQATTRRVSMIFPATALQHLRDAMNRLDELAPPDPAVLNPSSMGHHTRTVERQTPTANGSIVTIKAVQRELRVEGKRVVFESGANRRGSYLRITESNGVAKVSVTLPHSVIPQIMDLLKEVQDAGDPLDDLQAAEAVAENSNKF